MFAVNEDKSIYVTRGDAGVFRVAAKIGDDTYTFHAGDTVRMKVFGKKDCENVVLRKDVVVEEETQEVKVFLSGDDTKFGEVISKPMDYWYEIELNPETYPQTIVGYDDDGAKIFKVFPEGSDITGEV